MNVFATMTRVLLTPPSYLVQVGEQVVHTGESWEMARRAFREHVRKNPREIVLLKSNGTVAMRHEPKGKAK